MTKEEFAELQLCHQQSGKTLKEHLREKGLCYSTYNYWRRKYLAVEEPHGLAPISFRKPESCVLERRICARESAHCAG